VWLRCVMVELTREHRERLLCALAQGDKQAFAKLFRDMAPRLRGFFIKAGFKEEADELAQETLLRVWRSADRYDPRKGAPATWIFTIARNLRIDRMRRKRIDVVEDDPARVPDPERAPDAKVSLVRRAEALHSALGTLPEAQAQAVQAVYFEHQSARAYARAHDIPEGTVKSRLRLALRSLRKRLDTEGAT